MEKKKRYALIEQEEVEKDVEDMEKKKEVEKEASALVITRQTEELEKVQDKLKNVRKELDLAEGRSQVSNDLEKFMARQIAELEEELVCPVCLEVTTKAPIYKCADDHLICRYWSALGDTFLILCFAFRLQFQGVPAKSESLSSMPRGLPKGMEKVDNSFTLALTDFSLLRFRVAEKQGEKLEALLDEKLALSENL